MDPTNGGRITARSSGRAVRLRTPPQSATTKRYHDNSYDHLGAHLDLFLDTTNHARRLKTLKGLTPAEFVWTECPSRPDLFYDEP